MLVKRLCFNVFETAMHWGGRRLACVGVGGGSVEPLFQTPSLPSGLP